MVTVLPQDGESAPSSLPPPKLVPQAPSAKVVAPKAQPQAAPRGPTSQPPSAGLQGGEMPLLLDVTPHPLAVETAGGFCEQIIERNAPIPTEQTRLFSTSQDNQIVVAMRVCQGEERRTDANQVLGTLELLGLRQAPRGEVSIGVTFVIDQDGTLNCRAQDRTTGRVQEIKVNLVGALSEGDILRMQSRQNALYSGR